MHRWLKASTPGLTIRRLYHCSSSHDISSKRCRFCPKACLVFLWRSFFLPQSRCKSSQGRGQRGSFCLQFRWPLIIWPSKVKLGIISMPRQHFKHQNHLLSSLNQEMENNNQKNYCYIYKSTNIEGEEINPCFLDSNLVRTKLQISKAGMKTPYREYKNRENIVLNNKTY